MKLNVGVLLASLASTAIAFEGTVPCLMWSPKDYLIPTSNFATSGQVIVNKDQAITSITSALSEDACHAKAIAIVDQPHIHLNDFARSDTTNTFAAIKEYCHDAISRTELEYIADSVDVNALASRIVEKCGHGNVVSGQPDAAAFDKESPVIALLELSSANDVQANDAKVDEFLKGVREYAQDDHVVIYTSSAAKPRSSSSRMYKRSLFQRRGPSAPQDNRPIFAKYQLFTPGIFMAAGVAFTVLTIVSVGISWLVGIQTPIRFEGKPKKA